MGEIGGGKKKELEREDPRGKDLFEFSFFMSQGETAKGEKLAQKGQEKGKRKGIGVSFFFS